MTLESASQAARPRLVRDLSRQDPGRWRARDSRCISVSQNDAGAGVRTVSFVAGATTSEAKPTKREETSSPVDDRYRTPANFGAS